MDFRFKLTTSVKQRWRQMLAFTKHDRYSELWRVPDKNRKVCYYKTTTRRGPLLLDYVPSMPELRIAHRNLLMIITAHNVLV